jgi:hypothetical protein
VENLAGAIKQALVDGQLPCALAFMIAAEAGLSPLQVGEEADRLDVRLSKCQLGLFGYGPKAEGKHRQVTPMTDVPADLAGAIRAALGADGKLSCSAAWQIATRLGLPKQTVSDAVEGLGLRVSECQLGAF